MNAELIFLGANVSVHHNEQKNQIFGHAEHELASSIEKSVDFPIARKVETNDLWLPLENLFSGHMEFLPLEGMTGTAEEVIEYITQNMHVRQAQFKINARKQHDHQLISTMNGLIGLKERLTKASAEVLQDSFIRRSKKSDLDELYKKDVKLLEKYYFLLNEDEILKVDTIFSFFEALDNCAESDAALESLRRFCKS